MKRTLSTKKYNLNENDDIAIPMSPAHTDPVIGLDILGWLEGFKYLNQYHCSSWGDLNI